MGRWRIALAFGLIGVMVVALVAVLLAGGEDEPASAPTTSASVGTTSPSTSTSVVATTTTTVEPVDRIAEVERILEDLEIAWYDAVYRQDESVLPDIVATRLFYDAAVDAMGAAQFAAPPSDDAVDVTVYDILLDRDDCLVVHFQLDLSGIFPNEAPTDGVQTLWPSDAGEYRLVRLWSSPNDFWDEDCDSLNRDEIP